MSGWGLGEHDSCYFLEATVGYNPDSCLDPHSTKEASLGLDPGKDYHHF